MTREQIEAEFKDKLKQYGYSHHAKPIIDFAEHIAKLEREACIADCKAEIEQLRAINASLRTHNEGLDAECARLEKAREYIPMTFEELGWECRHGFGSHHGLSDLQKAFVKRARLIVKERE